MNENKKKKAAKFTIKALVASFVLPYLMYYLILGVVLLVLGGPYVLYSMYQALDRPWYFIGEDRSETLIGIDENRDGIRDDIWDYVTDRIGEEADKDIVKIWKLYLQNKTKVFSLDLSNKEEVYNWAYLDEKLSLCVSMLYENLEDYGYGKTYYNSKLTLYIRYLFKNTDKRRVYFEKVDEFIGEGREVVNDLLIKNRLNTYFTAPKVCSPFINSFKLKKFEYERNRDRFDKIILEKKYKYNKDKYHDLKEFLNEYI